MRYEREIMPLMRCALEAGDWLYIPAGYWHMATAEQTAISLAIGVMSHAAVEVLDLLRRQLPQSILWRQRLPVAGAAAALTDEQLRAMLRDLLVQLRHDLASQLTNDSFLSQLMDYVRRDSG
jgi:ribosomal protein L16 Arg81 hydroxylase